MTIKQLNDTPAYDNCYQLIAITNCKKNVFCKEAMRNRLKEIIELTLGGMPGTTCITSTVAFNHVHVLLKTELDPLKITIRLFGIASRIMRNEYPELLSLHKKSLWDEKTYTPVTDEEHFHYCLSYMQKHQPDNTTV